jgi:hypothetical protein
MKLTDAIHPRLTSTSSARTSTNAEPPAWALIEEERGRLQLQSARCSQHLRDRRSRFTTQGCYEPTLTIMAISDRAGEHIARAFRRGEL